MAPDAQRFSTSTITALVEVVTGGSGYNSQHPIGIYRSGPKLEMFFGGLDLPLTVGSRVPSVRQLLMDVNARDDGFERISKVIESVADPREYLDEPDRLPKVIKYLNDRLRLDGVELLFLNDRPRLVATGTNAQVVDALRKKIDELDLGSVARNFDRAIEQADKDPEDAVTAACCIIESVCKHILDRVGQPYPSSQDVSTLVKAVQGRLNLSPSNPGLAPHVKQILGGLASSTSGIGVLRTYGGDAHGHGSDSMLLEPRIARLAIHAASAVAIFFIETWQAGVDATSPPSP